MPNLAVVGAQWGDEGKGKVVDLLSERFDVVARYQGGPNAGHTVTVGGRRHALHHVPSGVFREGVRAVIGNGTVLDLGRLVEEIEALAAAGVRLTGRLFVSDRAHVILPPMARLDEAAEESASEGSRIGTTRKGIGPAYQTKTARGGIRMADVLDLAHLEARIGELLDGPLAPWFRSAGSWDRAALAREIHGHGKKLEAFVADTSLLLNAWIDEGKRILFEGAQGTLLDLDHGSYPFVTSSSTVAGGLCGGLGISPTRVAGVVGVLKAYCTRVGCGPMPTELHDGPGGLGEKIRERGREYGTTTGRPRRCGWFDGAAAAYANRINRFDSVCVMLLDVLDVFDSLRVCTGYRLDGREVRGFPATVRDAERLAPVFETLPGWRRETSGARRWDDLPAEAKRYLARLEEVIGAEVGLVSVGPDREQSILRPGTWLARALGS